MSDLEPEEQEDVHFVEEYIKKIRSFEWRVDAEQASKAFLDEYYSPLFTVGTKLQKAMEDYRIAFRTYQIEQESAYLPVPAHYARQCIENALNRGIIVQGDGLTGKLEQANKKIEELEREKTSLENQLTLLKKNEKLENEKKTYKKLNP